MSSRPTLSLEKYQEGLQGARRGAWLGEARKPSIKCFTVMKLIRQYQIMVLAYL